MAATKMTKMISKPAAILALCFLIGILALGCTSSQNTDTGIGSTGAKSSGQAAVTSSSAEGAGGAGQATAASQEVMSDAEIDSLIAAVDQDGASAESEFGLDDADLDLGLE